MPQPLPIDNGERRPLPQSMNKCPHSSCGGNIVRIRNGDYVTITCLACSRSVADLYLPIPLDYQVRLPLQPAEIAELARRSRARPKPKLDVPEPELTKLVEQYCDLRQRGFTQAAIRAKTAWPRHYPNCYSKRPPGAASLGQRRARNRPSPTGCSRHSTPASKSPPCGERPVSQAAT